MVFDHAITLGQEIDLFWRKRWTGASAIFLLNRYLALVNFVLAMCEYAPKTELVRLNLAFTSLWATANAASRYRGLDPLL